MKSHSPRMTAALLTEGMHCDDSSNSKSELTFIDSLLYVKNYLTFYMIFKNFQATLWRTYLGRMPLEGKEYRVCAQKRGTFDPSAQRKL